MIIHGKHQGLIPAHMHFGTFILQQLTKAKKEFVCLKKYETGEELTNLEFAQYAVSLSAGLTELGVKRGDVVAVGGEPRITFQPTTLAVVLAGATYTPYSLVVGRAVLEHKLNLARPNYFICTESFWKSYGDIIKATRFIKTIICFDEIDDIKLSVLGLMSRRIELETFEPAPILGHLDTALILYSSGTTGMPKAILLTHLNCISRTLPIEFEGKCFNTAVYLGDWYHDYEIFMTYIALASGIGVIYVELPELDVTFKCIQDNQASIAFLVPRFIGYLAKEEEADMYNLSSLTTVTTAGSPLPETYVPMLTKRFPNITSVVDFYGMSEVGTVVSVSCATKGYKAGSVGMPVPGAIIKVVDTKTREILGPNQRGELCLRSPSLMKCYLGVDETTYLDDQGFLLSGDLAYFDEDGYIYIVDRLKDMICYDSYEVAPQELEAILLKHPAVQDAGVVGRPGGDFGELPAAVVVRRPGHNLTEQELLDYVSEQASPIMKLRGGVKFVSELPRNSRGKVLRRRLREMFEIIE